MNSLRACAILLLLLAARPVRAQLRDSVAIASDPLAGRVHQTTLHRGSSVWVRAWTATGGRLRETEVAGRVDSLGYGALFVAGRTFPVDSVTRLRVSVGRRNRAQRDGAIGLAVGLALGLAYREIQVGGKTFQTQAEYDKKQKQALLIAGGLGAVGYATGAMIGTRVHSNWIVVDLNKLRAALLP